MIKIKALQPFASSKFVRLDTASIARSIERWSMSSRRVAAAPTVVQANREAVRQQEASHPKTLEN
jgi:hypothetical protein